MAKLLFEHIIAVPWKIAPVCGDDSDWSGA